MKKLSVIVAGAAMAALTFGAPAAVGAAAASTPNAAPASHVRMTHSSAPSEAQIAALFDTWNAAVQTGDAEKVADLYAPDAVLLPTLSPVVRTTRDGIVDYFQHFLARNPSGERLQSVVKVLDERSAIDTGVYRFTFRNADGTTDYADARYTFVYEKVGGEWLIINHHSSLLPAAS